MKRIFTIMTAVFLTATVWAQAPQKMSYQSVVRDAGSNLITNTQVGLQVKILQGSATGTEVYTETQTPTTNINGLLSIEIGGQTGFDTITWANGPYFIETSIDPEGGTNYTITGTSQLLNVPYALYAKNVENDQVDDADADPTNELQDLNLNGTTLEISDGANVDLSSLTNSWKLTGNTGTTAGTNFIGTTDNTDLDFKTNNILKTRISTKGQIEILNTGQSVFIGEGAGAADDLSDNQNIFIGYNSGTSNTTGQRNTASGYQALYSNTTGNNNTAMGYGALQYGTTGGYNVASGYGALFFNTTGHHNTASGYQGLRGNTTGNYNTALGDRALYTNTTGSYNLASGNWALYENTTGNYNTALGSQALYHNTTGYSNIAIGKAALYRNTSRSNLVAIGDSALYNNGIGATQTIHGKYNTAVGTSVLYSNTTGYRNTASGYGTLSANTTGNSNTAMGFLAFSSGNNYSNSTALGYYAYISASNQIRLGNSSVTSIGGYANWTNVSDKRFKKDINEDVPGLDFIMKLTPVTYRLDMDAIAEFTHTPNSLRLKESEKIKGSMLQTGFIAQDVEKAAESTGYDFSGVDKPKNKNDYYGLRYAEFVVPLVKAVQEQQSVIENQEQEIENLKKQNAEILKRLKVLEK